MYKLFFKRVIDILIGLVALPFVLIIIICFGPLIFLTDKGPIFYNAQRLGKDGKHFMMYKLRSMYINSKDIRNKDGSTYNSDNDPRVTPIGRILRKTSLDEFPQFLNVLFGDMSFIGPRPTVGKINFETCTEDARNRYSVKPGVTGYAQAYYRNSITQEEKFHWDAYYADHVSFLLDVKIIWKTFVSVLGRTNINTEQSYKK